MKRIFAHIGFSAMIGMIVACLLGSKLVILFTIGLAILFIASLCLSYFRHNVSVPLCIGSALMAFLIFIATFNFVVAPQQALDHTDNDILFYVIEDTGVNDDGNFTYIAKTKLLSSSNAPQNIKIKIKTNEKIDADYYTLLSANARFYSISDTAFSSYGYWADGVYLTAVAENVVVTNEHIKSPMHFILHIRDDVRDAFDIMLGEDGSIATALLTGQKRGIDRNVINSFRYAGASHIMAVSGLHLSVITGVVLLIMKRLRLSDYIVTPITLCLILFYIALAGFSKSVLRAGIVMSIMVIAPLFKTRGDSINSLGLAVFLMCLNPFSVTDIGMLLSVLSTLALVISNRYVHHIGGTFDDELSVRAAGRLYNELTVVYSSIAILLFNIPVMYFFFGYVSVSSVVSNLLVLPVGSIAMMMSAVTYLCYRLGVNFITALVARLTQLIIRLLLWIVRQMSSFSAGTISLPREFVFVIIGVMLIIAVCFIFKNGVLSKVMICAVLAFAILSSTAVFVYNKDNSYVYVNENGAYAVVYDGSTVVGGVKSLSDFYDIEGYLISVNEDIDVFAAKGNDYEIKLMQSIPTHLVIANDISDSLLNLGCFDEIEISDRYTIGFENGLFSEYKNGDFSFDINGVKFSFCDDSNADVSVDREKKIVVDSNGMIDLSVGEIIYTIRDNTFFARRMNVWQG